MRFISLLLPFSYLGSVTSFGAEFEEVSRAPCPPERFSIILGGNPTAVRTFNQGMWQAVDDGTGRRFVIHTPGDTEESVNKFLKLRAIHEALSGSVAVSGSFGIARAVSPDSVPMSCLVQMLVVEVGTGSLFPAYKSVMHDCPPPAINQRFLENPSDISVKFYEKALGDGYGRALVGSVEPMTASYCTNRGLTINVQPGAVPLSKIPGVRWTYDFIAKIADLLVIAVEFIHSQNFVKRSFSLEDFLWSEAADAIQLIGFNDFAEADGLGPEYLRDNLSKALTILIPLIPTTDRFKSAALRQVLHVVDDADPTDIYRNKLELLGLWKSGSVARPLSDALRGSLEMVKEFKAVLETQITRVGQAVLEEPKVPCPPPEKGVKIIGFRSFCTKPDNGIIDCTAIQLGKLAYRVAEGGADDDSIIQVASAKAFSSIFAKPLSGAVEKSAYEWENLTDQCKSRIVIYPAMGEMPDVLSEKSITKPKKLREIATEAIAALKTIHSLGLIHGSISPHSIVKHGKNGTKFLWPLNFRFFIDATSGLNMEQPGLSRADDLKSLADALISIAIGLKPQEPLFTQFAQYSASLVGSLEEPNYDEWITKFR